MLTYSGIVGYGKVNLPSVESWGTNNNILRDPPRSLYTRRIDKVGDTSEITQMIEESGDRIAPINEVILTYARGVNPMVAVDYSNNGNNGGQRRGGPSTTGLTWGSTNSGKQSYLPYRILDKGAFRPPIIDQRSLLPLSRLPRVWTSSYTSPGFTDFSKKASCAQPEIDTETKGIKNSQQMLRGNMREKNCKPTFQLETNISNGMTLGNGNIIEGFEVRSVIRNPLKYELSSGKQSQTRLNGEMGAPVKQILITPLKVQGSTNIVSYKKDIQSDNSINEERYIHDKLSGSFSTNKSRNIQTTSIEDLFDLDVDKNIKDKKNVSYTTSKRGYDKYEDVHNARENEKNLPKYKASTNKVMNIHKNVGSTQAKERISNRPNTSAQTNTTSGNRQKEESFMTREAKLRPTLSNVRQEFSSINSMPMTYHDNQEPEIDVNKQKMRRTIYEQQQERNMFMADIPFEAQDIPVQNH